MRGGEAVAAACWIVFGAAVAAYALTFPLGGFREPGPGFLPFAAGLIIAALGTAILVTTRGAGAGIVAVSRPGLVRIAVTIGAIVAVILLLESLGFVLTIFFLMLVLLRAVAGHTTGIAVLYAVATAASVFVVFRVLLGMPLPQGWIGLG